MEPDLTRQTGTPLQEGTLGWRRLVPMIQSLPTSSSISTVQGHGRCRWSLFLFATLYEKHGHELRKIKLFLFMVGSESGPTTLRSQKFKGEGYSLSGHKGLTRVWRYEELKTSSHNFLSNSCYVPSGFVKHMCFLCLQQVGGDVRAGSPLCPSTFPRKVVLVLHWSWTWGRCLPGSPELFQMWHCGVVGASTQAPASGIWQNPGGQSWPSCM